MKTVSAEKTMKTYKPPKTLRETSMSVLVKKALQKGQIPQQVSKAPPLIRQEIQKETRKQIKRVSKRNTRQTALYKFHVDAINEYYMESKQRFFTYDLLVISIPRIIKHLYTCYGIPNVILEKFIESNRKFQKVDKFLPEGHHIDAIGWFTAYIVKIEGYIYLAIYLNDDEHVLAICIDEY